MTRDARDELVYNFWFLFGPGGVVVVPVLISFEAYAIAGLWVIAALVLMGWVMINYTTPR